MPNIRCSEADVEKSKNTIVCLRTGRTCKKQRYCSKDHIWENTGDFRECQELKK